MRCWHQYVEKVYLIFCCVYCVYNFNGYFDYRVIHEFILQTHRSYILLVAQAFIIKQRLRVGNRKWQYYSLLLCCSHFITDY